MTLLLFRMASQVQICHAKHAMLNNTYSYALAFSRESRVYHPLDLPILCLVSYAVAMKHKNDLCICSF